VVIYALQVYKPDDYTSPADADKLGTIWMGYVPSEKVDSLAQQIKNKNSAFYTGSSDPIAKALAGHVVAGFNMFSIADPYGNSSGGSSGDAEGSSGGSSQSNTRQDAIIGVVSSLGGVAVLVLGYLAYRSFQRRREMAHRRLSDPPNGGYDGARPEGREFDQDSVGGQRRRSFYFAEDSLRGYQAQTDNFDYTQAGGHYTQAHPEVSQYDVRGGAAAQMMQRRNVMPGAISAPILRENSMNW
jgi:hypothetical protein